MSCIDPHFLASVSAGKGDELDEGAGMNTRGTRGTPDLETGCSCGWNNTGRVQSEAGGDPGRQTGAGVERRFYFSLYR